MTVGDIMDLNNENIKYWLAAYSLPQIGPVKIYQLLNHFTEMKSLFDASTSDLASLNLTPQEIHAIHNPNWRSIENDLKWCEQNHCQILTATDSEYPPLLKELNDAPIILFLRGQQEFLTKPQIAIVGSRNPTPTGREIAEQWAYTLSQSGFVITSGLALGIDAASHRGALNANQPTIAVTGSGLKKIYPYSNTQLSQEIITKGLLLSEFPPSIPPVAHHFPRRNRIISGLSLGVLVIEAALKSGSLITARFAAEQGREVFAIPGSIHNPLARGCHYLIQQGAKLVEKAEDILEELKLYAPTKSGEVIEKNTNAELKLSASERQLLGFMSYETTSLDSLSIRSGLTVEEVSSMLLPLELRGYVKIVLGGYSRTVK